MRLLPPLGDTTQFHSPYLRHLYVRELAVGEVGDGGAARRFVREAWAGSPKKVTSQTEFRLFRSHSLGQ